MPRIDDYITARKIAIEQLSNEAFDVILARSGFEPANGGSFRVPFLNRVYRVGYSNFDFEDLSGTEQEIPIQEQILLLHYMSAASLQTLSGNWVSYREIPGASFYFSAFVKRAIDPLKRVFGPNIAALAEAAKQLKGKTIEPGDAGFEFDVLPNVPLQLILYEGDDEFPAEASILFDQTVAVILSPEDIAWLAGMLVYRLIAISKGNPTS
jgi:hypothetical protein